MSIKISLTFIMDSYVTLLTRIDLDFGSKNAIIIFVSFPNGFDLAAMYSNDELIVLLEAM